MSKFPVYYLIKILTFEPYVSGLFYLFLGSFFVARLWYDFKFLSLGISMFIFGVLCLIYRKQLKQFGRNI